MDDITDMPAWVDGFINAGPRAAQQAVNDVMQAAEGEYRRDLSRHRDTGATVDSVKMRTKLTARTAGGDLSVGTVAGVMLERGTSRQPARPHLTRAVRRAGRRWKDAVGAEFDAAVRDGGSAAGRNLSR